MANLNVWDYKDEDKIRIGKEICDLYRKGEYTLEGCATAKGIAVRTFYGWTKKFKELSEYLRWTKQLSDGKFDAQAKIMARKRMLGRLSGTDKTVNSKITFITDLENLEVGKDISYNDFLKLITTSTAGKVAITQEIKEIAPSDNLLLAVLSNVDEWDK